MSAPTEQVISPTAEQADDPIGQHAEPAAEPEVVEGPEKCPEPEPTSTLATAADFLTAAIDEEAAIPLTIGAALVVGTLVNALAPTFGWVIAVAGLLLVLVGAGAAIVVVSLLGDGAVESQR